MKFVRDALVTFGAQLATAAMVAGSVIVVARALGPPGLGAYSLVILIPNLLVLLGHLGIDIANVYFGGTKKHDWADLVSNSLVSGLMLGVPLVLVFLTYYFVWHPSFLADTESRSVLVAALVLPFILVKQFLNSILLGQNRIAEYNLPELLRGGALLSFMLLLLVVLRGGVFEAILAYTSAVLIATILSIVLVHRVTRITWAFHPRLFKDSVKFGVKAYLASAMQYLNYRLDMILVAYFMGVASVGYYAVAVSIVETLWYLPAAMGTVIFARTPGISTEEANRATPVVCRNTFFIAILAALALAGLGRYIIILLFDTAFLEALKPLWILIPGAAVLSIAKVLGNELNGRGKPIINTLSAGVSLAVNVPLNLLLIPKMGIEGAALASTISYTVTTAVVLVAFARISKASILSTIIIKPRDLKMYADLPVKLRDLKQRKSARPISQK